MQKMIDELTDAMKDAAKHDKGVNAAGTRVRKTMQSIKACLLYTSPSPRDKRQSRMPSSA